MGSLPVCPTAHPRDDDLTGIVTHLAPVTTRHGVMERNPNEPEVRWLLEAGIRAMCEGMLDRSCESSGPVAYSHANGLFDTLPVEKVMRCFRDMCSEQGIDPGSANKARLIRRWAFVANYQLDLIAYVFRPALMLHSVEEAEAATREAWNTLTFGEIVDAFSVPRSKYSPLDSIYRIQQILRLMFPADAAIQGYTVELHKLETTRLGPFYAEFAAACGLTPRIDTVDLAAMMQLIGHSGLLQSATMGGHLVTTDGIPLTIATIRAVLESAYGLPWSELSCRRPGDAASSEPVMVERPADTKAG